jgi:hypothetical protein
MILDQLLPVGGKEVSSNPELVTDKFKSVKNRLTL